MDCKIKNIINSFKSICIVIFLLAAFILLFNQNLNAQQHTLNFIEVESGTYSYYQAREWDSLIDLGERALKDGHDYFYLRVRLGIALFSKERYFEAAWHLEKAHQFNKNDKTAIEYLFYSYLYTNRNAEAFALKNKHKLNVPEKTQASVLLESGPILSDNINRNRSDFLVGPDSLFGKQNLSDNKYYNQIGIGFGPVKNTSFYFGYNQLIVSKLKQIQTSELVKTGFDTILDNGWYYVDTLYGRELAMNENRYQFFQHALYFSATQVLKKGWLLNASLHWLYVDYTTIYADAKEVEYFAQSYDTVPNMTRVYTVDTLSTQRNNIVVSATVYKSIKNINTSLFGSYSDLNYQNQFQTGIKVTYFPKGNLNLYASSKFIASLSNSYISPFFELSGGGKIFKGSWLEGSIAKGPISNFNENDAYVVYNSGDKIRLRAGANIIVLLSPGLELTLRYQHLEQSTFLETQTFENSINLESIKYSSNLIIGGITWKLK
ncbi:MAG: hypothetical protein K9G76_04660 [Bacteroidales bacterium]|nr:hypothetical protein [Bacteroidales bacterium]MCF8402969.1 hypothetical protein [Bacteroidales bacterium]